MRRFLWACGHSHAFPCARCFKRVKNKLNGFLSQGYLKSSSVIGCIFREAADDAVKVLEVK